MTQTIGQRLKAEREERRLTHEKVFEATRIRIQYLQALEEDDLSVMPSPVQARGYLRNYAEYLGFDVDQMLRELRQVNEQPASSEVIGPADAAPAVETVTENKAEEPPPIEATYPAVMQDAPEVEERIIPVKPKTTRRKKVDTPPGSASAETPTRRRGRKKVEPEPPETQNPVEEPAPLPAALMDANPPLPPAEETAVPVASSSLEPAADEERSIPPDAADSLWQSWLNRVGSMIAARGRRRTLVTRQEPLPESDPILSSPEIEPAPNSVPLMDSTQIFKEIGLELRQRRELLSLHFDEIERNTHVKAHYLEALERGALEELPSTVQTRGMLSNYATFLDLDVDTILLRFADALQARHRERNPYKPARKPGQPIVGNLPSVRSFIAGDMIFGIGMAVLLVGFAIWGVSRVMAIQGQQGVDPTAPSISDVLLSYPNPSASMVTATFLPAVEAFPGEATVTVEIPTQNANAEVQLNLVAVERTYMRVVVDGEIAFDGRVVPGNAYPFEAETQVEVLVGSGAAIRVVYNGRDLGLLGTFGQVVNQIYLGTEIVTPTGLPTLTPTITPTPTRTAPPTATSRFTDTPAPSATAAP